MTLEEIKDFRSRFVRIHHEANGDKILVADWMQDHYDWLIAKVERLQAENILLRNELIDQVGDTRECYLCLSPINLRDRTYHKGCATLKAIPETTKIHAVLDAARELYPVIEHGYTGKKFEALRTAVKEIEGIDEML